MATISPPVKPIVSRSVSTSSSSPSATPGATAEDAYAGHLGRRDVEWRNVEDHYQDNPGGLAVVWAEENSRDAIFAGLKRREAYATSGTRPTVRFCAGAELPEDLCGAPDMIERAYGSGTPMGGELDDMHDSVLSRAPSTFAALLDTNPVADDCGLETTELVGRHVLLGVMDRAPEGWR